MINIEDIKRISAEKRVHEIVVEKDYILDWVLWGISQFPELTNNLVFKGGTALHKIYFPDWRFSEDLDFTTINRVRKEDLERLIPEICESVQRESGIYLTLREIASAGEEEKEWSFEINIEYVGPRGQRSGSLPVVTLHITNDELILDKPLFKPLATSFKDVEKRFSIITYSLEEIIAEKLRSVLHQRCWPRDVYDLWRLFKEVKNLVDITDTFSIYEKKMLISRN